MFTLTRWLAQTDGSVLRLGILGASNALSYAFAATLFGAASDRIGRRRLIAAGAAVYAATYGLALGRLDVPLVYLEAVLGGVAVALVYPPLIPLLSAGQAPGDRGRASTRPLIRFCLSWNLGVICGNLGGGSLFPLGPGPALAVGLALSLVHLGVSLGLRVQPPGAPTASPAGADATTAGHAGRADRGVDRATMRFFAVCGWAANVGGAFAMSLILYIFPRLLATLEVPAPVHGAMIAAVRLSVVAIYALLHFTHGWRYRIAPSLAAQLAAVVGSLVLAEATQVATLTAGAMLVGAMMGYNYFSSIFYSTTGFDEARRGLASGLHEAALAAGFMAGSLGGGYLGTLLGLRAPYLMCAGVLGASLLLQGLAWTGFRAHRQTR